MTVTASDQGTPKREKTVQVTIDVDRNLNAPVFTNIPSVASINEDIQPSLTVFTVNAEDGDTQVRTLFIF